MDAGAREGSELTKIVWRREKTIEPILTGIARMVLSKAREQGDHYEEADDAGAPWLGDRGAS
jgi:hypothetical protein